MARAAATDSRLACEELIIDVPQVMEPVEWPECCIYRVPKVLRMVNKEAYTPKLISIGPLHHDKEDLRDMQLLKPRYFKDFCYRSQKCQKELASMIQENEFKIRRCYSETSILSSEEFVSMILLDGIFIIELFLRKSDEKFKGDYILSKPLLTNHIMEDLILLENQLPFFILREIHDRFSPPPDQGEKTSFLQLACKCLSQYSSVFTHQETASVEKVKHFTDLLRTLNCPSNLGNKEELKGISLLYSATKLDRAGVEFKGVEDRRLLEIEFKKLGCLRYFPCFSLSWLLACLPFLKRFPGSESVQPFLQVPQFIVDDGAECLYRNLMALEQCHYPRESYICDYIGLWDALINTEKDVDLLVDRKAIVNFLGSNDEVATLVNKLGHQIAANDSYFHGLVKDLNEHYENFWNRHMASLRSVYFPDIWRGTATVVGLIVLGFTLWGFIRSSIEK